METMRQIILQLVESLQLRERGTRRNNINLIFHCTVYDKYNFRSYFIREQRLKIKHTQ